MIPHAFLKINDFQRQLRLARRYNNMMLLGVTNSRNSQISCVLQSSSKMVHFTQVVCFGQSTSFHYKSSFRRSQAAVTTGVHWFYTWSGIPQLADPPRPKSALFFLHVGFPNSFRQRHRNWCWTPRVWPGWVSLGNCCSRPWKTVASKALQTMGPLGPLGPWGWWDGHGYHLMCDVGFMVMCQRTYRKL